MKTFIYFVGLLACIYILILKVSYTTIAEFVNTADPDEFVNTADPDEMAHNEPSHLDLQCFPSSLLILRQFELKVFVFFNFADAQFCRLLLFTF